MLYTCKLREKYWPCCFISEAQLKRVIMYFEPGHLPCRRLHRRRVPSWTHFASIGGQLDALAEHGNDETLLDLCVSSQVPRSCGARLTGRRSSGVRLTDEMATQPRVAWLLLQGRKQVQRE